MITVRHAEDRGRGEHGWLDSRHTFSFADYYDVRHMGFSVLRVINEDRVAKAGGFGTHGHRDMEIISYVLEGALEHRDSMGNGSVLKAGDFQRMSAGTGVRHSEYNPSATEPVHFYQIWILPDRQGIEPSYEERRYSDETGHGLTLVASPTGDDGSMRIHQDARLYLGRFRQGQELRYAIAEDRNVWVQVTRGNVLVNGVQLSAGDGVAVEGEEAIDIRSDGDAELLLFDLP